MTINNNEKLALILREFCRFFAGDRQDGRESVCARVLMATTLCHLLASHCCIHFLSFADERKLAWFTLSAAIVTRQNPRVTKKVKKWSIQMLMMIARRHQINLDSFRLHWNIQKWNGTRISKKLLYHILSPTKIDHHFSLQTFGFAIQKNNSETSGFRLIYLKRDTKIGDLKCVNFTYPSECQR